MRYLVPAAIVFLGVIYWRVCQADRTEDEKKRDALDQLNDPKRNTTVRR